MDGQKFWNCFFGQVPIMLLVNATSSIRVKEKTKPGDQVKTRLEIF